MKDNNPLVSIIIITYNSEAYVRDTLNSAINQTYRNIEIIVSDDNSYDNTVDVCKQWILEHKRTDIRLELITTNRNTGTSGNCNRGLFASKGEWVKIIGGDDMLASNGIKFYVDYVTEHPSVKHLIADKIRFHNDFNNANVLPPKTISPYLYRDSFTVNEQYYVITKRFFGSGPTYFVNSECLRSVGGFDERFPLQEDYPLYIKMIGRGFKMEHLNKVTVYYRVVENSVSHTIDTDAIFTKNQVRMIMDYKYLYRKEALSGIWKIFHFYSLWLQTLIVKKGNNKKILICAFLKLLYSFTDPFVLFSHYINYKEKYYLYKTLKMKA